eukprot:1086735-Prorocentrum_lima.AAC.1
MMQLVTRRVEKHAERPRGQLALKQGGGIQQGVHRVRGWIQQQNKQNTSWACFFIDYEKAYDKVDRSRLLTYIKATVPPWLHQTITQWYQGSKVVINIKGHKAEVETQQGIRQGDPLASILFSLF